MRRKFTTRSIRKTRYFWITGPATIYISLYFLSVAGDANDFYDEPKFSTVMVYVNCKSLNSLGIRLLSSSSPCNCQPQFISSEPHHCKMPQELVLLLLLGHWDTTAEENPYGGRSTRYFKSLMLSAHFQTMSKYSYVCGNSRYCKERTWITCRNQRDLSKMLRIRAFRCGEISS